MDLKPLDDRVSVSGQVAPGEIGEIARRGFTTLICNRPDGEAPGQPRFEEIAEQAREAGMEAVFLPVTGATLGPAAARQFADAIGRSDGPVLAYCRTGTRSTALWTLSRLMEGDPKDRLRESTARAGYDMSGLLDNA
ncbi:TIGR01244 family sulfur transferase [Oricola cellulosilytica]|uniref:TIGR01244 family phosphatase n=1 Tax=Oricola cellulosilytica TaxID=1429082 RepID=A0A4R0P517_9HYPH|nr:TIGR01244 family sulfur transferase [Oricola cellulosilytica]TCD11943.1 TIGR01244 family phosphatase [Oricola cellulosilytica]